MAIDTHAGLSYEAWLEKYKPVRNPFNDNGFDGLLFETFGKELEFVAKTDQKKVWTLIDGDGASFIEAGFHFVNRLGYFVTDLPVAPEDIELPIELIPSND